MAIIEGLASFGISLGAGIIIEGRKLFISSEVQVQIGKAFEDSLKEFCSNPSIREKERTKIRSIIEKASKLPSSDLRNEEITGEYSKFFSIFESKLVQYESAFRYLKEIRDEARYQEILIGFKTALETVKDEFQKNISSELEQEYKSQIDQYKTNLESLKPRTAYSNVIALEKRFEVNDFSPNKIMLSSLEVLKGQCLKFMPDYKHEWQKAYIRAYNLNEKSRENLENACYAYFKLDEFSKAEILADKLLKLDEFNSSAWVVKILTLDNKSLCEVLSFVPKIIFDDLKFKDLIHVESIGKGTYLDMPQAFSTHNILNDAIDFNSEPITLENFRERAYLVNCANSKLMKQFINFQERILLSQEFLAPIFRVQQSFINAVDNSEIEGNHNALKFLNSYIQFLMDGEKDHVYKMKDFYLQLETIQPYYTLVLANSIQLIGEVKDAIKIITNSEEDTLEILALKLTCYLRLNEIENYIITAKKYLRGITEVTHHLVNMFIIAEVLKEFDLNSRISNDEYIKDKSFPNNEIKNLLIELLKVFKNEQDTETIQSLDNTWASGNITEGYMRSSLAGAYLLLKEYSKAINVYKEFLDFEKESPDLLNYIHALYSTKSKNSELLKALQNWREKFSFNPKIFQLEIVLKRHLFKWNEILTICERYFDKDESNEFIVANYAIAINEIDNSSKKQFERLSSLADKIEFNSYSNARAVAETLMQNNFQLEGLELYYRQAIDESNSQARTDYFMACVKCPKGILKNFEIIEEGHFVKFENKGGISFVEISNKNVRFKQLLGKKVDDEITFYGDVGKSENTVVIKRIMNKYLDLHDKILNEVDNKNPFSEIPMESYNVEKYIQKGNILDFFEELAGKEDFDPDKLINDYYSGKLSFTELVSGEYSNHFIRAYYNLEYDRKGIVQYTAASYPDINLSSYEHYILDFTSLLRLFELSQKGEIKFNKKFTLATSTKSMIKAFSKEYIGHSGNQYILGADFYKELLGWIDINCELQMATSKLDIINAIPKEASENQIQGLLLDTITLMLELTNSILITDDSMMLRLYPIGSGRVIGTATFYLKEIIKGMAEEQ